MASLATAPTHDHLRSTPGRVSSGTRSFACAVEQLTTVGAVLRCADKVRPWTVVTLRIDHFGLFHGRILWQRDDSMSLQFLDSARAVLERSGSA